jgi:hypothetical protein
VRASTDKQREASKFLKAFCLVGLSKEASMEKKKALTAMEGHGKKDGRGEYIQTDHGKESKKKKIGRRVNDGKKTT